MRNSTRDFILFPAATTLLVLLPLILATPSAAFGYADPGSGAFLYQAAYAAFLGGTFYLRKLLNRFFGRSKTDGAQQPSPELSSHLSNDGR